MFKKTIAIMISAILMLTAIPLSGSADNSSLEKSVCSQRDQVTGELPIELLTKVHLSEKDIPEAIDQSVIETNNYANRLYEQESLNTVIFQKTNGDKVLYSFENPIKYVDSKGQVQDKSNQLSDKIDHPEFKNDYCYYNAENDVKTYFPKELSLETGISLNKDDFSVEMSPFYPVNVDEASITPNKNKAFKLEDENKQYVVYDDVFGDSSYLKYNVDFNGFKEDIILEKYEGINRFSFLLTTNGLALEEQNGAYFLINPDNQEKVFSLGDIIVSDSRKKVKQSKPVTRENAAEQIYEPDHNQNHHYEINSMEENQKYLLTIVVDEDYFLDDRTVYPVIIDPSIFQVTSSGIQDANIYSIYSSNSGLSGSLYAGKYDTSTYGVSRFLMKFPGLMSNATFNGIVKEQIINAQLYLRDVMCYDNYTSFVDAYMATQAWAETTVTKNNPSNMFNSYQSAVYIDSWPIGYNNGTDAAGQNAGNYYPYNIYDAIYMWKNGQFGGISNHFGLLFKADTESLQRVIFASAQRAEYQPYIKIEYEGMPTGETSGIVNNATYLIKNRWTGKYLDVQNAGGNSGSTTLNTIAYNYQGNLNQVWQISYAGNGLYKVHSCWLFATQKSLHVANGNYEVTTEGSGDYFLFWIVSNGDGSYRFMNKGGGNTTKAMDVNGNTASADYQKNVLSFEYKGTDNQKWELEKVEFLVGSGSKMFESLTMSVPGAGTVISKLYYECTVMFYTRATGVYIMDVKTVTSCPQAAANWTGDSMEIEHVSVSINGDKRNDATLISRTPFYEQSLYYEYQHKRYQYYSDPVTVTVTGKVKNIGQGSSTEFSLSFDL